MVTRRALLASAAALAAGCSSLESSFSVPSLPKDVELTWGSFVLSGLFDPETGVGDPETRLKELVAALAEDSKNPNGPAQGRYTLDSQLIRTEDIDPQPESLDEFLDWIGSLEVDLLSVGPNIAQLLGERGIILPLDPLIAADEPGVTEPFYPYLLDHLRSDEGQFGLPVEAKPLMLHYDPVYFAEVGVPPVDENWHWDDLAASATSLIQRDEEDQVQRWGLAFMTYGFWWALWQNEADIADATSLRCLLQDPAAVEALQFCRDLIHTHRVAPPVTTRDSWTLFDSPSGKWPAMMYGAYRDFWSSKYRWTAIPKGEVRSVSVAGGSGIAIMARTENTEAAYTALKGLVNVMQRFVPVPAQREAVARLGDYRKTIPPEEVAAIQQSMEHGRGIPIDRRLRDAMRAIEEGIVRGDDVLTVVNEACSSLEA